MKYRNQINLKIYDFESRIYVIKVFSLDYEITKKQMIEYKQRHMGSP